MGRVGDGLGTEISVNRNVSIEAALSLENETRIANVNVRPDLYEKNRMIINREKFSGGGPAESGQCDFDQGRSRDTSGD